MKYLKKIISVGVLTVFLLYSGVCVYYYFKQEKIIFDAQPSSHQSYSFPHPFEDVNLITKDGFSLHSLHFQLEKPKGVVYYLHGKSGNLKSWGAMAKFYLELGYDVFMMDYRGFGKSEGKIENEKQFYEDVQLGYDFLKEIYSENEIVIVGFSMGSGAASYLSSVNHPKLLVLKAPYFSLTQKLNEGLPLLPDFLFKYKFSVYDNVSKTKCPILIFHGDKDVVLRYDNALKLKKYLKKEDQFITLRNQPHFGINENSEFRRKMKEILNSEPLVQFPFLNTFAK